MKKILSVLALLFAGAFAFAQESLIFPYSEYNVKKGEEIKMITDGYFITAKPDFIDNFEYEGEVFSLDFSVPSDYGKNCFVANFERHYFLNGKEYTGLYELIFTDITVSKEFKKAESMTFVEEGTVIGKSKTGNTKVFVRSKNLDPNLVSVTSVYPVYYNDYWYFAANIFLQTSPKFLEFRPITSKKTEIPFDDAPDTLAGLAAGSSSKDASSYAQFPVSDVMFKTKLSSLPVQSTKSNRTEILLYSQYFRNCPTETKVNVFGTNIVLHFQPGFDDYLKEEYTLGKDIYIYCYLVFTYKGELHAIVRDYTLVSPETFVEERTKKYKEANQENLTSE